MLGLLHVFLPSCSASLQSRCKKVLGFGARAIMLCGLIPRKGLSQGAAVELSRAAELARGFTISRVRECSSLHQATGNTTPGV